MDSPASIVAYLKTLPLSEMKVCTVADVLAENGGPAFDDHEMTRFLKAHNLKTSLSGAPRHYTPDQVSDLKGLLAERPLLRYPQIRARMQTLHGISPNSSTLRHHDSHRQERNAESAKGSEWPSEMFDEIKRMKGLGYTAAQSAQELRILFANHPERPTISKNAVINQWRHLKTNER